MLEASCKLIPSPQHRSLVLLGYDDAVRAPPTRCRRSWSSSPIGLETFDRRLVDNELRKGFKRHPELLPDGDAWLLVEFGADSERRGRRARPSGSSRRCGARRASTRRPQALRGRRGGGQIWEIREGGVGHSKVPGEHPGWPSLGGRRRRARATAATTCATSSKLATDARPRVSCYFGHVGHGCLHTRLDLDFPTPRRRPPLPRVHGGRRRPRRLLRRLAFRRARRRPGPRRALDRDVRPRARPGVPRVQGDLGSRRADEPGQGRRPLSAGHATCGWRPTYRPRQVADPLLASPTTAAASRPRPSAASASAPAATRRA